MCQTLVKATDTIYSNYDLRFFFNTEIFLYKKCNYSHYDGESLRDEKVRYDLQKKDTVFNVRYGFRDSKSNLFYLTESRLDGTGIFSKTSFVTSEVLVEMLKQEVEVPVLRLETSSAILHESNGDELVVSKISSQVLKSLIG